MSCPSRIAFAFFFIGAATYVRFLYFFVTRGTASGHLQSLLVGTSAIVLAFVVGLVAMLAELLAANRRLLEDLLVRVRNIESRPGGEQSHQIHNVWSTGARAWTKATAPLSASPAPSAVNATL